jgi:hypothetical protein
MAGGMGLRLTSWKGKEVGTMGRSKKRSESECLVTKRGCYLLEGGTEKGS